MMMMARILLFVLVALIIKPGSGANTGVRNKCSADSMMEDFEKSLMTCTIHSVDYKLMIKIIENIKHLEKLLTLDFVCGYENDMAKLMNCMVHKYAECLPSEIQKILAPLYPTEDRWKQIIKLACDNRKVLGAQCMTQDASSQFMNCYKNKLLEKSGLIYSVASSKDLGPILCHIRQSYEHCISKNSGSCSARYVSLVDQVMAMVINIPNCPTDGDSKVGSPFDAVLLQGHPLKFRPMGKVN